MQNKVASLIRILGACELEIEKTRVSLAKIIGSNHDSAFRLIDNTGTGYIDESNLSSFLNNLGVYPTLDEISRILKYYDFSGQKRLNFNVFANAITPRDNKQINPFGHFHANEPRDIDRALANFFSQELQLVRKTNPYRIQLAESETWTSFDSFKLIDIRNQGSFSINDLDEFLQNNGVLITHHDLQAAFNRIDKAGHKRINYPQFKDNLLDEDAVKLQLPKRPLQSLRQSTTIETPVKATETPVKSSSYYPSYSNYYSYTPTFVPRIHDYLTFPEVSTTTRTVTYKDTYHTPSPYRYSKETNYERYERYPSHRPIYKGDGEYYVTKHYSPVSTTTETITYANPSHEIRHVSHLPGETRVTTIEHSSPIRMKTSFIETRNSISPTKYSYLHQTVTPSTISSSINYVDLYTYNIYGRPWRNISSPYLENSYYYKPLAVSKYGNFGIYDINYPGINKFYSKDDSFAMPRGTESTLAGSRYNMTSASFLPSGKKEGRLNKSSVLSSPNLRNSNLYESSAISNKYDDRKQRALY